VVRALKAREDAAVISLTYFYRPFQGSAGNAWPYQALRASRWHLATFFRLRRRLVVSSNATCPMRNAMILLKQGTRKCVLQRAM